MLTVDFDRLGIGPLTKVIDVGCGAGRHAFEAYRRGADVVAFDRDWSELRSVKAILRAMAESGEAPVTASAKAVLGDALSLPYPDGTFDCAIASEILEHVPQDDAVIAELIRVLKAGGTLAVSVPRWLPEQLCWLLSEEYHSNEGGHVRIYRASELRERITGGEMELTHSHRCARTALAILVAEMCCGRLESRSSRSRRIPQAAGMGSDAPAEDNPNSRDNAQSARRQERGNVFHQATYRAKQGSTRIFSCIGLIRRRFRASSPAINAGKPRCPSPPRRNRPVPSRGSRVGTPIRGITWNVRWR